jgi:hypothetical protein
MHDPLEIAWAAGLFEGEGCIFSDSNAGKRHQQRCLILSSTDEDVVRRFAAAVGVGKVHRRTRTPAWQPHWKDQWEWRVNRWTGIVEVLDLFKPFLGERRTAAANKMLADPPWQPGQPRKPYYIKEKGLVPTGAGAIRAWARSQGIAVSTTGPIPTTLRDRFHAATTAT